MGNRPQILRAFASGGGGGGGGGAPSGSAGGDLTGTYPNPTIAAGAVDLSGSKATGVLAAGRFPALTGAITTSAGALATTLASGAVAAANLATSAVDLSTSKVTGLLQAASMPALTGDVTTAGGALATTIANGAVTVAKQANMAAQTILGNATTSSAAPTAMSVATAQALLREGAVCTPGYLGNIKAAAGDPCSFGVNTNPLLTASTTYMIKIWLPPGTYTNYLNYCQTIGATLTATTFCFYLTNSDATGTLVANSGSADAANSWLTAGIQSIALGTPLVVTVGAFYYINVRIGAGTTMPKTGVIPTALAQNNGGNNVAPNGSNTPRFAVATNSPSGITPPSTSGNLLLANAQAFWMGLN